MKQWMKFGLVAASLSVGCGGSGGASGGDPGDASVADGPASEAGGSCTSDPDCAYVLASTTISVVPAGCADAKCDKTTGQCKLVAHDGDLDGYGTANCAVAGAPVPWTPGNDCDDNDINYYPGQSRNCSKDGSGNGCRSTAAAL